MQSVKLLSRPSSPVAVAAGNDARPSHDVDAIYAFLQNGGYNHVDNRISVANLATALGLPPIDVISLLSSMWGCKHLFRMNDHSLVATATVYAINPLKGTLRSRCSWFHTWHTREFQLVQGEGFALLLRSSGGQLRQVSVVTSNTKCELQGSRMIISNLEPEKEYYLESVPPDDDGAKIGEWVTCLQAAIKNLQKLKPEIAPSIESEVECKNAISLTWHRRTVRLMRAGGRCFILRKMGTKLRGVAVVSKDTKADEEGSHELRIPSLRPEQCYHLRFTDSQERDKWLDIIRRASAAA